MLSASVSSDLQNFFEHAMLHFQDYQYPWSSHGLKRKERKKSI